MMMSVKEQVAKVLNNMYIQCLYTKLEGMRKYYQNTECMKRSNVMKEKGKEENVSIVLTRSTNKEGQTTK